MADRVDAVREIAISKRGVTPRLTRAGYVAASDAARPPVGFRKDCAAIRSRGSSSRRRTSSPSTRRRSGSCATSSRTSAAVAAGLNLRYAKSKNLTPYDVLIIASMIEKETVVPSERRLVVGGDLQPAAGTDAARDRRDAPLRPERPRDRAAQAVGHRQRRPVQHAQAARAAADADLEPRARVAAGGGAAGGRRLPLLRPQAARARATSSRRARPSSARSRSSTATAAASRGEHTAQPPPGALPCP